MTNTVYRLMYQPQFTRGFMQHASNNNSSGLYDHYPKRAIEYLQRRGHTVRVEALVGEWETIDID